MPSMPTLAGATHWINSPPLSPPTLRGSVVLVNFWTLTCINWLRTVPYIRAWSRAYRDDGLVVVGVHTPEFAFEQDIGLVEAATSARGIGYPVVVDNDYAVWNAFGNRYWPAVYLFDEEGGRRGQHFGEGGYEQVERAIQRLLGVERPFVSARGVGVEAEADWRHLRSPETYLGHMRSRNFTSADDSSIDEQHCFIPPDSLPLNHWSLVGAWTIGPEHVLLHQPGGSVAYRFLARDAHLVVSSLDRRAIPFRVLLDGSRPGPSHGVDVDEDGLGVLREGRMYQLVRTRDQVDERTVEVIFSKPGVLAYVFTFG